MYHFYLYTLFWCRTKNMFTILSIFFHLFFISSLKASVSIWGLQWPVTKLCVPAHWNSPSHQGSNKGECFTILYTTRHLFVVTHEIITALCVSTDGSRCNALSSHSPLFQSRKQQLPASFRWLLNILRTVTRRQTVKSTLHTELL